MIGDGKSLVWGQTMRGRYLQVTFTYPEPERVEIEFLRVEDREGFQKGAAIVFVIHAMDLDAEKKRRYRQLRGSR